MTELGADTGPKCWRVQEDLSRAKISVWIVDGTT